MGSDRVVFNTIQYWTTVPSNSGNTLNDTRVSIGDHLPPYMVNENGSTARQVETLGVPQKVPEHELPRYPGLHQAPQILIDKRPSAGETERNLIATIDKAYMVETPASTAAANVSSVAKALFQRCAITAVIPNTCYSRNCAPMMKENSMTEAVYWPSSLYDGCVSDGIHMIMKTRHSVPRKTYIANIGIQTTNTTRLWHKHPM